MKKLHLENARILRGIYFIDPEDHEFKETIKNNRKKLETSVAPAMPRVIMKKICRSGGFYKMKKTRLAVKIHYSTTIWFANLFLCLKLWKFWQQKQWWTRNGKIGKIFGVEPDESMKSETGDR